LHVKQKVGKFPKYFKSNSSHFLNLRKEASEEPAFTAAMTLKNAKLFEK